MAAASQLSYSVSRATRASRAGGAVGVALVMLLASFPFWADSGLLGAAGIPTVLYGPRGEGLHAEVEWVEIASAELAPPLEGLFLLEAGPTLRSHGLRLLASDEVLLLLALDLPLVHRWSPLRAQGGGADVT